MSVHENIGMYALCLLSLFCFVHFSVFPFAAPFLPFFSFFIALWAVCMLEVRFACVIINALHCLLIHCILCGQFWKRKEKTTAMEWGTINYEIEETDRPGTVQKNSRII